MTLVIHPSLRPLFAAMKQDLPSTVILHGEAGVGLLSIARWLGEGSEVIVLKPELITKTSTVPQIAISRIRDLYEIVRSRSKVRQVVIIDDAEMMSLAAQNAFLKLLEEPNSSTHFILTTHALGMLLPTVRSRAQLIRVPRAKAEDCQELYQHLSLTKQAQLRFIAEGLPAEIIRLAADETYYDTMVQAVRAAKELIEADGYERLAHILKQGSVGRYETVMLIDRIIYLLKRSPKPHSVTMIEALLKARSRIEAGGNVKLQLAAAMVQ